MIYCGEDVFFLVDLLLLRVTDVNSFLRWHVQFSLPPFASFFIFVITLTHATTLSHNKRASRASACKSSSSINRFANFVNKFRGKKDFRCFFFEAIIKVHVYRIWLNFNGNFAERGHTIPRIQPFHLSGIFFFYLILRAVVLFSGLLACLLACRD